MATKKVSRHAAAVAEFDAQTAALSTPPDESTVAAGEESTPAAAAVAESRAERVVDTTDWSARARELEEARAAERNEFATREQELKAQVDADRAETQRQLAALRDEAKTERDLRQAREAELAAINNEKMFSVDLSGFEHVSPEAARELNEKIMRPIVSRMQAEHAQRLEGITRAQKEREERINASFAKIEEDTAAAARARTNRRLLAEHPDFAQVTASAAFSEFKAARIPGTRTTWGSEMAKAYAEGDAAYVNEALSAFKSQHIKPQLSAVAEARSGGGSSTVATQAASTTKKYSYSDLEKWRSQRRRGEISRAQELSLTKAFKVAEAAGDVE